MALAETDGLAKSAGGLFGFRGGKVLLESAEDGFKLMKIETFKSIGLGSLDRWRLGHFDFLILRIMRTMFLGILYMIF